MKKAIAFAETLLLVCGMCTAVYAETADESSSSSASAAEGSVIEISTAEELAAVADDLSADYVLVADIDLEGMDWTPIGSFVPSGESEEEQETPSADEAFTGTFNGNGYTISNLSVSQPEDWALGLFGCISNAEVGNFTLAGASVEGSMMLADVVGYSHFSRVWDVSLINGSISANATEMSAEGMYGGIVGAGMGSVIEGCRAQADITIPDGTANAGIVGGGLEMTSVIDCQASGTVTAGNSCYGLGGISGCGFAAEEFTDCTANDVTITAGDDCFWIGGITGYTGGYEDESFGMPVTVLTNCTARNVTVTAGENADGVDDIVGAGFFNEEVAQSQGAPFDQPTVFELVDCRAEEADERLSQMSGTYIELFPEFAKEEYHPFWLQCIGEFDVDDETAEMYYTALTQTYMGRLTGEEAVSTYADDPESMLFDCFFENDLVEVTIDGDEISGVDASGNEVFRHTYSYVEDQPVSFYGEEMPVSLHIYKTDDADAGMFTYFAFADDTPGETWHIEFRYGENAENMGNYSEGDYAYWLAGAIEKDYSETTIKSCIHLFVDENVGEMTAEAEAEEAA